MTWWFWPLAVLFLTALLFRLALRSFRKGVRDRLLRFLWEEHPEIEVLHVGESQLTLRTPKIDGGTFNLNHLYRVIAQQGVRPAGEEREVFARFLAAMTEHELAAESLSLEEHGDRLLPRLVPHSFFAGIPAGTSLPRAPLAVLGLEIVYVLDAPNSVRYLSDEDLEDLGLDWKALHERALANLEKGFSPERVRRVVEVGEAALVKAGDGHDAARLLLVPRCLRPGEEIAAVIPDANTLALLPLPEDGDWSRLQKVARASADGKPLLNRPLRITAGGYRLV